VPFNSRVRPDHPFHPSKYSYVSGLPVGSHICDRPFLQKRTITANGGD
jgi:hypothetical protein